MSARHVKKDGRRITLLRLTRLEMDGTVMITRDKLYTEMSGEATGWPANKSAKRKGLSRDSKRDNEASCFISDAS